MEPTLQGGFSLFHGVQLRLRRSRRLSVTSRSWLFYTPRSKYHIGFSGERMTVSRRYKKIQRFSRIQYIFGDISLRRSKR